MPENTITLAPASEFTIAELVNIYNRARVDYLIPMPMNAARLEEYIHLYNIDLARSLVASQGGETLGVAMLGVRPQRAWATRLGVIPDTRRRGAGQALMKGLLEQAEALGISFVMLEVIKNNVPAHQLFLKLGFYEVGELLILRRSPALPPPAPVVAEVQRLERLEALDLAGRGRGIQPWTNQSETLFNAQEIAGLRLMLADGSEGWLVYQRQKFTLTRFIYKTESGDPLVMARAFLSHLHAQYPRLDTHLENIQANDPHLPAFYQLGYIEAFRRIEMWRGQVPASQNLPTRPQNEIKRGENLTVKLRLCRSN